MKLVYGWVCENLYSGYAAAHGWGEKSIFTVKHMRTHKHKHKHTSAHKGTATAAEGCIRIFLAFYKDFLMNF